MRTFRGKFIFFRQISFSNALFKKSADWSMTHPTGIRNKEGITLSVGERQDVKNRKMIP